jgi:glucokinase
MRVGIDLGGTNIAAGLVNEEGIILDRMNTKTDGERGAKSIIGDMIKLVVDLALRNKINMKDIAIIGIGVPGLVNYEKGIVEQCVNLYWKNVSLREDIIKLIKGIGDYNSNLKILIENDANAAATGEYLFGSMKNNRNSLLITLGTGIGGGLVLDGKLFRGRGAALEIGHMVIGENFYNCSCGNNGCFETFASATAIIKYAKKLIVDGEKSIILDKVRGDVNKIDAKIIFECANIEDKVAILSIQRFTKYLAVGVNNIINVLDVDLISIGGGVAAGKDIFMDNLIKEVGKHKLYKNVKLCKIETAALGNDAGIIGAAMLDKI